MPEQNINDSIIENSIVKSKDINETDIPNVEPTVEEIGKEIPNAKENEVAQNNANGNAETVNQMPQPNPKMILSFISEFAPEILN